MLAACAKRCVAQRPFFRSSLPGPRLRSPSFQPSGSVWWRSLSDMAGNNNNGDDDGDSTDATPLEDGTNENDSNAVAPLTSSDKIPKLPHVLAVPTTRRPLFPGVVLPMTISNAELSKALLAVKESGQPYVGVFLKKPTEDEHGNHKNDNDHDNHSYHKEVELITDLKDIHEVGSYASIDNIIPFDGTTTQALMVAHRRIRIDDLHEDASPMRVNITTLENEPYDPNSEMIKAYSNEIVATLREVVKLNPLFKEHMQYFSQRVDIHNPYKLADFAASVTTANAEELQEVLAEMNCEKRLQKALELIMKEWELSKVQQSIKEQVEEKVSKNQRRYLLMEQLKTIKKELGMEKDDKEAMIAKYRDRISSIGVDQIPSNVMEVMEEEMDKLSTLEKNSSEYNVTRNYLDWLTQIPWGKTTEEMFDIGKARAILNEDHYGLQDIKDRILEFIAVGKLKENVQGRILCLVGPPGVGKTSIGKSIARALNREFYRFSVGGLTDVAEIKGHRRTYIGAMPGKIIQCLKTTQSSNPVILIDEIDKLGKSHGGDPASALLELLDPGQNPSFVDHYLDVPVDLSKVLFICTANVSDTIPGPLQDRMEMLRLSGYDAPEKVEIAKQYLDKKTRNKCGLEADRDHTPASFELTEEALKVLIKKYCREAGVRGLEQQIEKIFRKVALEIVTIDEEKENSANQNEEKDFRITPDKLEHYVGKPIFNTDRMYDELPPGVIMGLAYTAMGGSSLYIETSVHRVKGEGANLVTTGQMGSVMEESTRIAHTYARKKLADIDASNTFFEGSEVHLHVPEGATPKDGPSAGCTMVTALLSLAMDRPALKDLAMTGEVSLIGKVLPVGGIKEKTIAARRAGVKTLVLPKDNQRDFEELPSYLKDGIDVHYADYYNDVFKVAFPSL